MALRNVFLSPTYAPDLGDIGACLFFRKKSRSDIRICVTMTSFLGCSGVTGNLKKVPKDPLFLIIFFVACSLVSYLSRVARINVTEQVLASESRHAARRRKNASSISDPPCIQLCNSPRICSPQASASLCSDVTSAFWRNGASDRWGSCHATLSPSRGIGCHGTLIRSAVARPHTRARVPSSSTISAPSLSTR